MKLSKRTYCSSLSKVCNSIPNGGNGWVPLGSFWSLIYGDSFMGVVVLGFNTYHRSKVIALVRV